MPKTNYTKVEGSFDDGLRKMMVNQLLNEADFNQGADPTIPPDSEKKKFVLALHHSLQHLHKVGMEPYKKMKIQRKKIADWIEHPETITAADWKNLQAYRQAIDKARNPAAPANQPQGAQPPAMDETLVNSARKKSVYKRFNVNDKWLPLQ